MSLIRKLRDRLQGATLHDLWVETRWVLHHSKRYRRSIAAYVLLGIASIALSLLSSLSSRELINAIVYLQGGGRRVLFCGVTVVLLAGSTIVLNALVSRFSAKINLRIGNELRAEVFGMFLNTDWESLQQFHSGDLLSRINTDVSNVAGSVLGWIPSLILRLTQFLASLAVILVYDPTMAVLALLSAPVTLLLSRPLVGKMRSFNRDMRAVGSEMTAFQEETLQNIPAIKAFHLVDAFRERLDRVQERYYDTGIAFQRFSILTSSFLSSCGMLVSYLCLGWGAYRLWQGRIDFGTMVLFLQLASYLSSSLSALIHLVPSAIEASVSARRIMSVLELPRERLDHPERAQRLVREGVPLALSLQGLEFSYQGRAPVLKQLDLQVQPHEMIAIVGPSGSGKTTLFRLLLGLLHPTGGSAVLTGGGGILLFDGLLLLPAGKRIAGKLGIFLQRFLVQNIYICLFQLALCLGCFAVRLQLVAAIALPHQISAGLHHLLGLVGAFHAHIVLLCFSDLFVELARDQMDGSFPDSLRNFGGWLFLVLKGQLRGLFSGIRVNDRLPDLFLWDIGLRLICSGRSFLRFTDRLFQCRVRPFLISKAQARLLIQTILPA